MTTLSKHITQKTFAVVFSIFFIVVVVVLLGSYRMSTELEKQLQQNLEDVANQNSFALYSKIESHYLLLDALSKDLHHQTPETIGKTMHAFTNILDTYHLKRLPMFSRMALPIPQMEKQRIFPTVPFFSVV